MPTSAYKVAHLASQRLSERFRIVADFPVPTAMSVVLLAYLVALLSRFRFGGDVYLSYFADDFFYYLKVAENVARTGVSTFDGTQETNGYHPLWMLILAALVRVLGSGEGLFWTVTVVVWMLVAGTAIQLGRLVQTLYPTSLVRLPSVLFSVLFVAVLARTGMEISLALFFLTAFYLRCARTPLEDQEPRYLFATMLLGTLAILARIDVAIAVGAMGIASAVQTICGGRLVDVVKKVWIPVAIGLSPLLAYVVTNHMLFGLWLPASGMAKHLKPDMVPSLAVVSRLTRVDAINLLLTWPTLAVLTAFIVFQGRRLLEKSLRVQLVVLIHPGLLYLAHSVTSDWTIWTWYLYPLAILPALLAPAAVELCSVDWQKGLGRVGTFTSIAFALAAIAGLGRKNPGSLNIYESAKHVQRFALANAGTYAMGDRAGTTGYLLHEPMVQLEGLVGNALMLEHIRSGAELKDVLVSLDVNYYVSTDAVQQDGCFVVREPAQAGRRSPTMHGTFCSAPVLSFSAGGHDTRVFAVKSTPTQGDGARIEH